jgi:hypothetical protein
MTGHSLPVCYTACMIQACRLYSRRQSGEDTPNGQRRRDRRTPYMGRQRLEWQPLLAYVRFVLQDWGP